MKSIEHMGEAKPLDVEQITELLRQAKNAHTEYEKTLGKSDEDWAGWYADFVYQTANKEGQVPGAPAFNPKDIKSLLLEAQLSFDTVKPTEDWQSYYAKIIAKRLGEGELQWVGNVGPNIPKVDDFMSGEKNIPATKTTFVPKKKDDGSPVKYPDYPQTKNQTPRTDDFMAS